MNSRILILIAIIVVFVCLHISFINSSFLRHREAQMAQYAKYARNFLKFGLFENGAVLLDVSGPELSYYDDYKKWYYSSHPSLPAIFFALSFKIFGVNEFVCRFVLLVLAVGCIITFYLLSSQVIGAKWAILSTLIFSFNPAFCYFSMTIPHLAPTLFFILLAIYFYLLWEKSIKIGFFILMLISQFLACMSDWPGYYAAIIIFLYHFFVVKRRRFLAFIPIIWNIVIFSLYLLDLYLLDPQNLYPLKRLFQTGGIRSYSWFEPLAYLSSEVREISLYFTCAVIFLSILWLILKIFSKKTHQEIFIILLLFLALDEVIFVQICYEHDYYSYYLVCFFSLASVSGVKLLLQNKHLIFRYALPIFFAVAYVGQSTYILHNRLTKIGAGEFYYKMALAINEKTSPEDKIIIVSDNIANFTPFYADRYALTYLAEKNEVWIDWGYNKSEVSFDEFKEVIEKKEFDYLVTTTLELARENIAFFKNANDLSKFSIYPQNHYIHQYLQEKFGEPVQHKGFLFYKLR